MSSTAIRAPKADVKRFCPYHGGHIRLADCPIVATNRLFNDRELGQRPAATSSRSPLGGGFAAQVGAFEDDDDADLDATAAGDHARRSSTASRSSMSMVAETIEAGMPLQSHVDGETRMVLARAPGYMRRLTRGAPALKAPAELAADFGGAPARPARACMVCRHPLPATIDYRDPYPVALVGHRSSSKTSTALAIIEEAGNCNPTELGASSFAPTEATTRYLQKIDPQIFIKFRRGQGPKLTVSEYHPPLEFVTTLGVGGPPISILLHDVAGEDLTDRDLRMERASSVLWADAIIFLYNPEDSPRMDATDRQDQAAILNGIRDDLEARGQVDAGGGEYKDPALLLVISKADLILTEDAMTASYADEDVHNTLRYLRDGAVINAARRFPRVSWHFMAPIPEDGGGPVGVIELFRHLLHELRA